MQTPAQVAKKTGLHVHTIRNWTKDYAELLSQQERSKGGARLFTDKDVEILCAIATLRDSGLPPKDVIERLRDSIVLPVIDVAIEPRQQESQQVIQPPIEAPQPLQLAYSAQQSHIETLARDVALIKAWQAEHDKAAIYKAERRGAVIALAIVGFGLLIAWLNVNGAPWG